MSDEESELDVLRRALNYDWPEIQKHLIEEAAKEAGHEGDPYEPYWTTNSDGTRTLHASLDSGWLKFFDRKDVLMTLPGIAIMNTAHWHADSACFAFLDAYGIRPGDDCGDCFSADDILAHTGRFPEGQFVAIRISGPGAGEAAGMAITMRTSRPPTESILPWMDAIGDLRISAHEPDGEWLYGVEMAVRPMYQGHGIGTGLYEARFNLVRRLNLRGWYAVGMLMGYSDIIEEGLRETERFELFNMRGGRTREQLVGDGRLREVDSRLTGFPRYCDKLSVTEYGNSVIARQLKDPTVTMQMNRGFRAERVITDYVDEPAAGNAGVLIVWDNPDYVENGG